MGRLETASFSPLYRQMMKQIRQDVNQGVYPVGTRIPPEHELESIYNVSRVTVRRALQELTTEGVLERKQGKGTFVAIPRNQSAERKLMGFHETCREEGKTPKARILRIRETDATPEDRIELGIPEGAHVIEVSRLLMADGEPVMVEKNHFSMAYAYLEETDLGGSLYRLLREFGVRAEKATYDISLGTADAETNGLLGVTEGAALIRVRQTVYDQKERPLHNSLKLIRGDRFTLKV